MEPVSEIKLIRTDTTLDLSQKAEKVWSASQNILNLYFEHTFMGTNPDRWIPSRHTEAYIGARWGVEDWLGWTS